MRGQYRARPATDTRIARIWADVTYAQQRLAEINRPWVMRRPGQG